MERDIPHKPPDIRKLEWLFYFQKKRYASEQIYHQGEKEIFYSNKGSIHQEDTQTIIYVPLTGLQNIWSNNGKK